jgi:hypothetical protein
VRFQTDSLDVGSIREDQDYGGLRILLLALVTAAKVRLQVDVGSEMPLPQMPSRWISH